MNIQKEVLQQQLVENAEAFASSQHVSPEEFTQQQINLIMSRKEAIIRSCKLSGNCIRCNGPIPIGGRPTLIGKTSLCEPCGDLVKKMMMRFTKE